MKIFRFSTMTNFWIGVLQWVWALGGVASVSAQETVVQLQGFDERGELVELTWPASIQWNWGSGSDGGADDKAAGVEAMVSVDVPEQLNLSVEAETRAKLIRSGARKSLVIPMTSPKTTVQLVERTSDAVLKKFGLVVTLIGDSPHVMIHESCARAGVSVRSVRSGPVFIFLAARCREVKDQQELLLSVSDDASLADSARVLVNPEDGKLIQIMVQKEAGPAPATASDAVLAQPALFEVQVRAKPSPPAPIKQAMRKQAAVSDAVLTSTSLAKPTPQTPVRRPIAVDLRLGHLQYNAEGGIPGLPYSEHGMELGAHTEVTPFDEVPIRLDVTLPLISWMPRFLGLPASGAFSFLFSAPWALLRSDPGCRMSLGSGLMTSMMHFDKRPGRSGFYFGPQVTFEVAGNRSIADRREYEARLALAPIAGHGSGPFMRSFELHAEFGLEAVMDKDNGVGEEQRRWDLVFGAGFTRIAVPDHASFGAIRTSLGVRTWY